MLWVLAAFMARVVLVFSATSSPIDWGWITAILSIDMSLTVVLAGVFTWATVAMMGLAGKHRSWRGFRSLLVGVAVGLVLVLSAVELYLLRGASTHRAYLPVFWAFGIDCVRTALIAFALPLVFLSGLSRSGCTRTSRLIGRCTSLAAAWGLITGIVFVLESVILIVSEFAEASSGSPSWSPLDLILYVDPLTLVAGLPYLGLVVASLLLSTRFAGKAYAMSQKVWSGARG